MKSSLKLLIISDKPEELRFLSEFSYTAMLLSPSKDKIEQIKTINEKFDLIIVNVVASFINVWELIKSLRNNKVLEYLPLIVLSELNDKSDEITILRSGADDFIKKPFDVDIFLARLEVLLRRSLWNRQSFINTKELSFINLPQNFKKLTRKENIILGLLFKNCSNDEIAQQLSLSKLTVKTHMKNIFKKLNVNNRTEAIIVGLNLGIIKS